jgi:hypothetical protein
MKVWKDTMNDFSTLSGHYGYTAVPLNEMLRNKTLELVSRLLKSPIAANPSR